jgi:hypothetical protein
MQQTACLLWGAVMRFRLHRSLFVRFGAWHAMGALVIADAMHVAAGGPIKVRVFEISIHDRAA